MEELEAEEAQDELVKVKIEERKDDAVATSHSIPC
jgi:hypothetical protein